jgi:hypothetical protein
MGGNEELDAEIAELLALLNAPEEQGPKKPPDQEVQPQEISPSEETRFAKNVTSVMQKHARRT